MLPSHEQWGYWILCIKRQSALCLHQAWSKFLMWSKEYSLAIKNSSGQAVFLALKCIWMRAQTSLTKHQIMSWKYLWVLQNSIVDVKCSRVQHLYWKVGSIIVKNSVKKLIHPNLRHIFQVSELHTQQQRASQRYSEHASYGCNHS